MGPGDLAQVLRHLPKTEDERALVGTALPDDAAVYRLAPDLAVVQTVDFITPVVDDPYLFGQVAAANALSDVWAMGAEPLFALNVVCFPVRALPLEALVAILQGGAAKCAEAGVSILGGHSVEDPEPKYGLVVTGTVHPERVLTKAGARPGDALVLTKPLGIGAITTAMKQGRAPAAAAEAAVAAMLALNGPAARAARAAGGVDAATDVTGFGLLGHLLEMAAAGGVGARVRLATVPLLPGARELARQGTFPAGARRNREHVDGCTAWDPALPEPDRLLLCDPQTSGGLLLAVRPEARKALLAALAEAGVTEAAVIGEITSGPPGCLEVTA